MVTERTVFNQAQMQVLNAMAHLNTESEILLLKQAISEFFARRADEEMEKLWNEGAWNEHTLENLKTAHYRSHAATAGS